jgi:7,8-dihydro-6-hydroxymethylpterin dimethyltransferase
MHLTKIVSAKRDPSENLQETSEILPQDVQSLCPECLTVIQGTLYEEEGQVFMRKTCATHGAFRELISTDATFHKLMVQRDRAITRGVTHPIGEPAEACPRGCGVCSRHLSAPMLVNIDLTNRCNLKCPICFANTDASRQVVELSLDQVRKILDTICQVHDVPPACLQLTGGEPTLHPQFFDALREARKRHFVQLQVATNGIRFAQDARFAVQAAEAGLNTAYLQFDGLNDEVYEQMRGRPLLDLKLSAIDHLFAAGIRTVLVPTVAKGINDDQIGDLTRFAAERTHKIAAISWQPVSFTGRLNYDERIARQFTMADLAREIETQTGYAKMYRDWYPFGFVDPLARVLEAVQGKPNTVLCCNPTCGGATYLIVDSQTGKVHPIPEFVDVEGLMGAISSAVRHFGRSGLLNKLNNAHQMKNLRTFYREDVAPEGWSFESFADFMLDFADFRNRYADNEARMWSGRPPRHRPLLMTCMHFQDVYNYQIDRVNRCLVHYAAPDGSLYPFCSYNSGPCHRNRIEKQFAIPLKQYQDAQRASTTV